MFHLKGDTILEEEARLLVYKAERERTRLG